MAESYDTAMDIDEPEAKRARVTPPPQASLAAGPSSLSATAKQADAGQADMETHGGSDDEDEVMMVGGRGSSSAPAPASAAPPSSEPPPPPPSEPPSVLPASTAPSEPNGTASTAHEDLSQAAATSGLVAVPSLDARTADGARHHAFMMADGDGSTVYYPITASNAATAAPLTNGAALPRETAPIPPAPGPSTSAVPASAPASLEPPLPAVNGVAASSSGWRLTHTLRGHQKSLSAVAFSPNGKLLASTGADKLVLLWAFSSPPAPSTQTNGVPPPTIAPQTPALAFIRSMKGHTAGLNDVAWAPDSRHFATCADDKTVRLWDCLTGECRKTLEGHTHHVFCVAYSPSGGLLISGGWDETIRIWDAKRGTALRTIPAHSESVTSVAFSRDGSVFASGSFDGLIRFWDTSSGRCLKTLNADDDNSPVSSLAFTPNSMYLLATTLNSQVRLWDYKSKDGRVVKSFGGHTNLKYCTPARFITTVPERQFVASGSEDGKIWLWDLQTRECVAKLEAHHDAVISIAVHPTLPVFVTVALERDPTAKVFVRAASS